MGYIYIRLGPVAVANVNCVHSLPAIGYITEGEICS